MAIQRHEIFDRWDKKTEHKSPVMKIYNIPALEIDVQNIQKLYT